MMPQGFALRMRGCVRWWRRRTRRTRCCELSWTPSASCGGGSSCGWRSWNAVRRVTEHLLPGLSCPCRRTVTFAEPPPGAHPGAVSYGPVLNAATVVLTAYGNVPSEAPPG
jgi:hypothetical protein